LSGHDVHSPPPAVLARDGRSLGESVLSRVRAVGASRYAVWLALTLGAVFRVRQYVGNRSLWLDESFVALNVIDRSTHRLLTSSLDFNQAAPAGFLLVEKASTAIAGAGEYALRAFPLVCGIASLLLFAKLARQVLSRHAVPIGVALFAVGGPLVYYSSELKPYAADVATTLALSVMAVMMLEERLPMRRAVAFGAIGLVLVQCAYVGPIVAAGTGAVVVLVTLTSRRRAALVRVGTAVGMWAIGTILFVVDYASNLGAYARSNFTSTAPDVSSYPPLGFTHGDLHWYYDRLTYVAAEANVWSYSLSGRHVLVPLLAAGLAVLGAVALFSRSRRTLAVLVAPVAVALASSAAHRYPLIQRGMLFLVPLLLLFIAEGLGVIARRLRPLVGIGVAGLASAVLLVYSSSYDAYSVVRPTGREEIKRNLAYVAQHWQSGDVLYLRYPSQYAFRYYDECKCFSLPDGRRISSLWPVRPQAVPNPVAQFPRALASESPRLVIGTVPAHFESGDYAADAARVERAKRAWILSTWEFNPGEFSLFASDFLGRLDRHGRRLAAFESGGTKLYLYELRRR
jgi:hypothetical protein